MQYVSRVVSLCYTDGQLRRKHRWLPKWPKLQISQNIELQPHNLLQTADSSEKLNGSEILLHTSRKSFHFIWHKINQQFDVDCNNAQTKPQYDTVQTSRHLCIFSRLVLEDCNISSTPGAVPAFSAFVLSTVRLIISLHALSTLPNSLDSVGNCLCLLIKYLIMFNFVEF